MKWLFWVLFGWMFGKSLKAMPPAQRRAARRGWHAFRLLTAKRKSSKLYHLFRLFD
ncbi:hypothetical protein B0813_003008 [Candidatus Fervidibacteria bacterium JGI MDM2 SSWTFF-3-K9]